MAIMIRCPACSRSLRAADRLAGKRVKCPDCGAAIVVAPPVDDLEVIEDEEEADGGERIMAPSAVAASHQPDSSLISELRPGPSSSEKLRRSGKSQSQPLLLAVSGLALALTLLAAGIGIGFWLNRPGVIPNDAPALAASQPASEIGREASSQPAGPTAPQPRPAQPLRPGTRAVGPAPVQPQSAEPNVSPQQRPERRGNEPRENNRPANGSQPTPSPPAASHDDSDPPVAVLTEDEPSQQPLESVSRKSAIATPDSTVRFKPLMLDEPASTMTMSEDGRLLFVAHEGSGAITVWDTVADEPIATIASDAPRSLLSRGNVLYVGNHGRGTISLFDETQDWQLTRIIDLDHKGVVSLSAPAGREFSSVVLATCHDEGSQASYQEPRIIQVDTRKATSSVIRKDSLATCSHDGKFVIAQTSFNLSPGGTVAAYPFTSYQRESAKPTMRGGHSRMPFIYQVHAGTWWIGVNELFAAPHFNAVHEEVGRLIVPDLSRKVIYALSENMVKAYQLNVALTELDSRRIELTAEVSNEFHRISQYVYRHRDYRLDHPLAFTHGERTEMFVLDLQSGQVLHAAVDRFAAPAGTPNSPPSNRQPSSGSQAEVSVTSPQTPPSPFAGLPEFAIEERLLQHQLATDAGRLSFTLVTGPQGLAISRTGELKWRPSAEEIGRHQLRIRVAGASEPYIEEIEIQVVPRSLADAVGGKLDRLQPDEMDLELDRVLLAPSSGGKALLLLQGDTLQVLSADGSNVTETKKLPNRYEYFDTRGSVLLGIVEGTQTLEIVDAKSFRTVKQIDLAALGHRVLEITDLAAHPSKKISYVGIKHAVDVPRYLVLVVDEQTGKTIGDPLLGTWVAIDPSGRHLITGYRDLYRTGTRFHINPNWTILSTPSYGGIDMLIRYEIGGQHPEMLQILEEAGGNGSGIRLSQDGRRVTYLSHVGFPKHSQNLPGFDADNLLRTPVSYSASDTQTPQDLAFHPTRPVVAIASSKGVSLLDRETGVELKNRLHLLDGALNGVEIERLIFSPDGNSLLLLATGGPSGRRLLRVNLDLSGLKTNPPAPVASPGKPAKSPPDGPRGAGI